MTEGDLFRILSVGSGLALSVLRDAAGPGSPVVQVPDDRSSWNAWRFAAAGADTTAVVHVETGLCLDVRGASLVDGAPIVLWPHHGGPNQRWRIVETSPGDFEFESALSGKVMDVAGASTIAHAPALQWSRHGGANQRWSVMPGLEGRPTADPDDPSYRPGHARRLPPWHLVDIWVDLGEDRPFESLSVTFTIDGAPQPVCPFYLAPFGMGYLDGVPFYGGLQSDLAGQRLIFSRWGERRREAIRPEANGWWESAGYEGDFVSVRRGHTWEPGRQELVLSLGDRAALGGLPARWIEMSHRGPGALLERRCGALAIPGIQPVLSRQMAFFVEVYWQPIAEEFVPDLRVVVESYHVNGEVVVPKGISAAYDSAIPHRARASAAGPGFRVEVGPVFSREGTPGADGVWRERLR